MDQPVRPSLRTILTLLAATFGAAGLLLFWPVYLGGPASYLIVSGRSMEPTLKTGDLVLLQRQALYRPGDVIAFEVQGGIVIHRIAGGTAAQGYVTRGDNKAQVDPWTPRPEEILGKMWFSIPGAGDILTSLRRPAWFAALVGLSACIVLRGSRVERRSGRKRKGVKKQQEALVAWLSPSAWMSLLELLLFAGLLCTAAAVFGYFRPAARLETVEQARYEQAGHFEYLVHTGPAEVYPDGVFGPVRPEAAGSAQGEAPGDPVAVFSRLARSLDLEFHYRISGTPQPEVSGEVQFFMETKAGNGWIRREPVGKAVSFSDPQVVARLSLDLVEQQEWFETLEQETGYHPGRYEITLVPVVRWQGKAGEQAVEGDFSPPFRITWSKDQILFGPELSGREQQVIETNVLRPQEVNLLGLAVPVETLRRWGAAGALVCFALAGLLAGLIFRGLDRVHSLQARYGSLLVEAAGIELPQQKVVPLASMQDLVQLARGSGTMILHQPGSDGSHFYFVPDGEVTYLYRVE